jgi:hypothetical protein
VLEEAKGVKRPGWRSKPMPRIEWDGGFLWKPCVPRQNDGIYQSVNQILITVNGV